MTAPFTPSTEGVRAAYAVDGSTWDIRESEAEFDRWLDEYTREKQAGALRDYAGRIADPDDRAAMLALADRIEADQ